MQPMLITTSMGLNYDNFYRFFNENLQPCKSILHKKIILTCGD